MTEHKDKSQPTASHATHHDRTMFVSLPDAIGHYRLGKLLGRGGMGEVWQAFDTKLERDVALKVMRHELLADEEAKRRFYREARAVARLNHPNIVQVYAIGEESQLIYMVMELVEGDTVAARLKATQKLSLEETVSIALQSAEGLGCAYERGIIHRDIKPSNLMLTPDFRVKIADFGLAKMLQTDSQVTQAGTTMGSPSYMSPEQARGEEADNRSDIYSLGITMFQMFSGKLPFVADTALTVLLMHIQTPLPEPEELCQIADGRALELIKRMTAKAPADRFSNYRELADAIAALAPGVRVRPSTYTPTASFGTPAPGGPVAEAIPAGEPTPVGTLETQPPQAAVTTPTMTTPGLAGNMGQTYTSGGTAVPAGGIPFALSMLFAGAGLLLLGGAAVFFLSGARDSALQPPAPPPVVVADTTPKAAEPVPQPEPTAVPTPPPQAFAQPTPTIAPTPTLTPAPATPTAVSLTPTPAPTPILAKAVLVIGRTDSRKGVPVNVIGEDGSALFTLGDGTRITDYELLSNPTRYRIRHNGLQGIVAYDEARPEITAGNATTGANRNEGGFPLILGTAQGGPGERISVFADASGRREIAKLPAGTEVTCLKEDPTVFRILTPDGKTGYIFKGTASRK